MVTVNFAPESDFLRKVTVRLLCDNEVGQFNFYLEREHYLQSSRFAGQSLRYVAEVDGQWVALLTFSALSMSRYIAARVIELVVSKLSVPLRGSSERAGIFMKSTVSPSSFTCANCEPELASACARLACPRSWPLMKRKSPGRVRSAPPRWRAC